MCFIKPRRTCAARVTVVVLCAQRRSKFSKICNIGTLEQAHALNWNFGTEFGTQHDSGHAQCQRAL